MWRKRIGLIVFTDGLARRAIAAQIDRRLVVRVFRHCIRAVPREPHTWRTVRVESVEMLQTREEVAALLKKSDEKIREAEKLRRAPSRSGTAESYSGAL